MNLTANDDNNNYNQRVKAALVEVLRQEYPHAGEIIEQVPASVSKQRDMLGNVVIASPTHRWKEETLRLTDRVWSTEAEDNDIGNVSLDELEEKLGSYCGTDLYVWRGDITTLRVDGIVNAANDEGLGCFVPNHKCVDNVIHRKAGPRLRVACHEAMQQRRAHYACRNQDCCSSLRAGTPPIVTQGYQLPSNHVIHVTGPQIDPRKTTDGQITVHDEELLASAYRLSLDAAVRHQIRSVAFPCISTGLFGFPRDRAAAIALSTVKQWLENHAGMLDAVVFNTFAEKDENLYLARFETTFAASHSPPAAAAVVPEQQLEEEEDIGKVTTLRLAKRWIDDADAILICAGAGMSVKPGEMVYTNPEDFARHYPWFTKWGYRTSYQVMGLGSDPSVPDTAKWALHAKHMDNMRWKFAPNEGYTTLLKDVVRDKDYFVLTSNVDGCFERSGFSPDRIYTPQGEWTYLQCLEPCRADAVYDSRPWIDAILPRIGADGIIPKRLIPKCPNCGGDMFGNVRGGRWFLHDVKYGKQNQALQNWMQKNLSLRKKVVVLEIGAGFNTPMVTRFPMESFVRAGGKNHKIKLIRINPSETEVPSDLKALAIPQGWSVLKDIATAVPVNNNDGSSLASVEKSVSKYQAANGLVANETGRFRRYFGHFDWKRFLRGLCD